MIVVASLVFGELSLQALGTIGPLSILCGMRQLLGWYLLSHAPLGFAGEGCTTPLPTSPVGQHTSTEWPLHQWTPCVHVLSHALFQLQRITPQQICIYIDECTFCFSVLSFAVCEPHWIHTSTKSSVYCACLCITIVMCCVGQHSPSYCTSSTLSVTRFCSQWVNKVSTKWHSVKASFELQAQGCLPEYRQPEIESGSGTKMLAEVCS